MSSRWQILIVDDDILSLTLVRDVLETAPCDVSEAFDGSEALAAVSRARPDLLLLDSTMPRMSGAKVLSSLKADHKTRAIPVVMMVEPQATEDDCRALLEVGASDVLRKPFVAARLLSVVERALGPARGADAEQSTGVCSESILPARAVKNRPVRLSVWEDSEAISSADASNRALVFLSYSTADESKAKSLSEAMQSVGLQVWRDKERLLPGQDFGDKIAGAIESCGALVWIVSRASIQSDWVRKEVLFALEMEKPVIPVAIPGVTPDQIPRSLKLHLRNIHWIYVTSATIPDVTQRIATTVRRCRLPDDQQAHSESSKVGRPPTGGPQRARPDKPSAALMPVMPVEPGQVEVMVCDDDSLALTMTRDWLEGAGYRTKEVLNGMGALEALQEHLPDVILLDIQMPGMNGLQTLGRIRGMLPARGIPVIMVTAIASSDEVKMAFDLGASDYIIKPIERERLLRKVEFALKKKAFADRMKIRDDQD